MTIKAEPRAKNNSHRFASERGFTIVQVLITVALVAVISAFALMAVASARASMRLTGSTREFAGYLEKARSNAIRRNGNSIVTILNASSYSVTMDFNGDGINETRVIDLQEGVTFKDGVGLGVTFDWRGRIGSAIRFELQNDRGLFADLQLSGSGDVTIGNESFEDLEIAGVTLNTNVPGGSGSPSEYPSPSPGASPEASPEASPDASPGASPSASPSASPTASPSASPSASPGASPSASPGASPSASPSGSPTQSGCTLAAPSTLSLPKNGGSKVVALATVTNANVTTFTATRAGDVTGITPGSTTLSGSGTLTYTITYANGTNKSGTVTISSACGTKTISVTID